MNSFFFTTFYDKDFYQIFPWRPVKNVWKYLLIFIKRWIRLEKFNNIVCFLSIFFAKFPNIFLSKDIIKGSVKKKVKMQTFSKKGGRGWPQSLHLNKSIFWQIDKKIKNRFQKFTFGGGGGGRSRPIWKKFTFLIFFGRTLPLSLFFCQ